MTDNDPEVTVHKSYLNHISDEHRKASRAITLLQAYLGGGLETSERLMEITGLVTERDRGYREALENVQRFLKTIA